MSDDLVARLRRSRKVWVNGDAMTIIDVDSAYKDFHDAADRIEQLEAERDELRAENERLRKALAEWGHYPTCERWRWLARPPLDSSQAPSCNCPLSALLDPGPGGESSVWLSAQPMSPTMRQAVAEAKQRPPARHFEPSTLLEDGERDAH